MKTFILVPLGVILACAGTSCTSSYGIGYQAAGYSPHDAYYRGQVDGSGEFAGVDGVTRRYKFTAPSKSNKNWLVAVGLPR